MPNPIIPKHNDTAGVVPTSESLLANEFCINTADGAAFVKRPNGEVKRIKDPTKVSKTSNESIDGIKTFNSSPIVPNATQAGAAVNFGQVLGVGQTWQNVTASRNSGVTYTNSTGKPIMVSIRTGTTGSNSSSSFTVNGTVISSDSDDGYNHQVYFVIIPPNGTYLLSATAGIAVWTELR